jgi:transcriptional regulator with GAF, ATPase, and Fis domain
LRKKPHENAPSNSICHLFGVGQKCQPPFSQLVAAMGIREPKMLTKGRVPFGRPHCKEAMMKPYSPPRPIGDVKEFPAPPKPVGAITPAEMQPTFTLTFSLGTPMKEIHDTVIRTVLQYTRSNRLRAAQLLQINPRTIRRRLGKKEAAAARAA